MFLTDFDEKLYRKGIYNDGYEAGKKADKDIGEMIRLVSLVRCKIEKNKSLE